MAKQLSSFSSFIQHSMGNFLILVLILSIVHVKRANGGSSYTETCAKNTDCEDTGFCNKLQKCDCKTIPKMLNSIYNSKRKICESLIGSVCTTREANNGWRCVQDAVCQTKPGVLALTLGICECKPGFFEDGEGYCQDYQKSLDELKDKPRIDHAPVPWANSGSTIVLNTPMIFFSMVIFSCLASFLWLPR